MNTKTHMPIQEFSILTGLPRPALRFYDKIGLLSPERRGENGYRYYTQRQIEMAFLISDLRAIGIGLEEIKEYADQRSPQRMLEFFEEQNTRIQKEIERLRSIQELMHLRSEIAKQVLLYQEESVFLEEKEREPIFLCPLPEGGSTEVDLLTLSYNYSAAHGVNVAFPVGVVISQKNLMTGDLAVPSRYYFKVRRNHNAWKSAGTYAVYYRRMGEDPGVGFYGPLLTFLKKNHLHMEGDAYEEYPLDELAMSQWEKTTVRIEVRVERG